MPLGLLATGPIVEPYRGRIHRESENRYFVPTATWTGWMTMPEMTLYRFRCSRPDCRESPM